MMHDKLVKKLNKITKHYYDSNYLRFKEELILIWKNEMGYNPDLNNPQTYNEKLLKLYLEYDQNKILKIVDKIEFKKWLIDNGYQEYVVETIKIFENILDLSLEDLKKIKKPFIIKLSNSTENEDMFIVREDTTIKRMQEIINHFYLIDRKYREKNRSIRNFYETWCYGKIKPRIIIEPLLGDNTLVDDFKVFNFKNKQFCLYMNKEEIEKNDWNWDKLKSNIYDLDNNQSIFDKTYFDFDFKMMQKITKDIASKFNDIKHIRVDFYFVDNKIYIGEITFNTANAFFTFWDDVDWKSKDIEWGKFWE